MTVGVKSTELGYSLAQKVLDVATICNHSQNGVWHCFKIYCAIPVDENQRGSSVNNYDFRSTDLLESATESEVEAKYIEWMDEQPYNENPIPFVDEVAFP